MNYGHIYPPAVGRSIHGRCGKAGGNKGKISPAVDLQVDGGGQPGAADAAVGGQNFSGLGRVVKSEGEAIQAVDEKLLRQASFYRLPVFV